jgi:3-oxoacyl-[acyl-carrier-protein] synthase II
MRAVAITGLGAVGPWGTTLDGLIERLRAGEAAPIAVDRSKGYHREGGARTALATASLDLAGLVPAAQLRRSSPPARFALAAAHRALADAGLGELDLAAHNRTAIVAGTNWGPATVTEQLLHQLLRQSPELASPAAFTESVASAPAAQVALAIGARGPNLAVTEREASDLLALAEGVRAVATGAADRALVIVVEEATPLLHAVLDRFRALARSDEDGVERARPFDRRRDGFLLAEGAAALVLEADEAARVRGARRRARVAAIVRGFDPSAPAWDWGRGSGRLAATLARGLERAGVDRSSIGLVVSGASGALRGDRLEAEVLRSTFGTAMPPIAAPKGVTGEGAGGFLAAAVLAAGGEVVGPTGGFAEADPELEVAPLRAAARRAPGRALVTALGSGGPAAWAVLEPV